MSCGSITTGEFNRLGLYCPCPFDGLLRTDEQNALGSDDIPALPRHHHGLIFKLKNSSLSSPTLSDIKNACPEILYTQQTFYTHLIFKVLSVMKVLFWFFFFPNEILIFFKQCCHCTTTVIHLILKFPLSFYIQSFLILSIAFHQTTMVIISGHPVEARLISLTGKEESHKTNLLSDFKATQPSQWPWPQGSSGEF